MRLNLETKTKEQELVKAYLEENASETLAEKINNGTPFEKDGKSFINKKTLDGFMKYASSEARKLASKGANSACVEDKVVYGWAIHYFEESGIEETLYNEDETEYKPTPKTPPAQVKKARTWNDASGKRRKSSKSWKRSLLPILWLPLRCCGWRCPAAAVWNGR